MSGKLDSTAHAAAVAKISGAASHETELRAHLDEIVKGPAFKGSHRSQAFLQHIVDRALHGDPEDLRERSIGIALFGRSASYDTADDAIVRVTASDVRKRLLQHYGTVGSDSRTRISLPPGSYVPEFSLPPAPVPIALPAPVLVTAPAKLSFRRPPKSWTAAIVVLLLAAATWLALGRWSQNGDAKDNLIQAAFRGTTSPVQIVVADDGLVLIEVLQGRRFSLEEYENLTYLQTPAIVQEKGIDRFWRSLAGRQITNLGDLQNADRMATELRGRNWEVTIRQARQMHARAFRTGNFVVLGSPVSNPWASLFPVTDSNFPYGELPIPGLPEVIQNRHPLPGEPATFQVHSDPATGNKITYARVSLVENLTHTGRVLLLEGQSSSATEMAGELLLRHDSALNLRKLLSLSASAPLPDLEMVVQVTEQNEIGERVELVTARKLSKRTD
ncbi:MAG TPA: hypothetical protein VG456_19530 [Candidatus Sulfopaludibacter sp.]|jgi:hypothetical protein|nr:hypothetical protein [Candidatus Sulfopaludibacter sp.]